MKIVVFLGSIRTSTPPLPVRVGERVAKACVAQCGRDGHNVVLIDPLDYDLGDVFKPHFSYAKGRAPLPLEHLASEVASADGYVMVSPEYNHSMSPALAHLLNHFGSSLFAFKPSAIVTYSTGQWGGRAGGGGHARFSVRAGLFAGVSHGAHPGRTHCFRCRWYLCARSRQYALGFLYPAHLFPADLVGRGRWTGAGAFWRNRAFAGISARPFPAQCAMRHKWISYC